MYPGLAHVGGAASASLEGRVGGVDSIRFTAAPSASHAAKTGSSPQPTPGKFEPFPDHDHGHERAAREPRTGPRSRPAPFARPPGTEPDEPRHQQWHSQQQPKPPLPARPHRRSPLVPRSIAETRIPRRCTGGWCTPPWRGKAVKSPASAEHRPQHRQPPDPAAHAQPTEDHRPRLAERRPSPAGRPSPAAN